MSSFRTSGLTSMDGCTLLIDLRKLEQFQSIPAISATGLGTPDDIRDIEDAGFDGYLLKPFDAQELSGD